MFSKSARYYDVIYSEKNYIAECQKLVHLVRQHFSRQGGDLLDVACGTGRHIEHLKDQFYVEGIDIDAELLAAARQRNPEVVFHTGDMRDFDLGQQYDLVTCLFSAIGYMKTLDELGRAVGCMARHIRPGGGLVIEPWFTPEHWRPGTVHAILKEAPDLRVVRMNTSMVDGRISWFDFHYLVATPCGVAHFVERHELGLFTIEEMRAALEGAGLRVAYDPDGLTGRGLYLGSKPNA
jgi:SAM-dependent methyltransferase